MAKVIMPLADGFEEIEAFTIIDVLRRAEIGIVTAGLQTGPTVSARKVSIIPDTTLDTVKSAEYAMIIIAGDQSGSENLKSDIRIHRLLKEFFTSGKSIGAIGSAPVVLAAAGLLNGKQVTSSPQYHDKLSGAHYQEKPVVQDGKIITSQGPATALEFALAIVTRLAGKHTSDIVAKTMLVQEKSLSEEPQFWDRHLFNSTVQALVGALEMKDSFTQGHAKRVCEYALGIGSKLGFSKEKMRDLYLGAMLYDIGKMGTAEDLLNKPDSLSSHEETLIREHPLKGTLFIAAFPNLSHLIPSILHHHEHWNGSGYPNRIKGEEIPLDARIICIADAFDAMHSPRSYRPALDRETAIQELQKQKGIRYDPFLVDVFVEFLKESPYEIKDFSYYFQD